MAKDSDVLLRHDSDVEIGKQEVSPGVFVPILACRACEEAHDGEVLLDKTSELTESEERQIDLLWHFQLF